MAPLDGEGVDGEQVDLELASAADVWNGGTLLHIPDVCLHDALGRFHGNPSPRATSEGRDRADGREGATVASITAHRDRIGIGSLARSRPLCNPGTTNPRPESAKLLVHGTMNPE